MLAFLKCVSSVLKNHKSTFGPLYTGEKMPIRNVSSWRESWRALGNAGGGSCGIYAMLQILLVEKRSMTASEAERVIRINTGTPKMRELLTLCRRSVVDHVRGKEELRVQFADEGAEGADDGEGGADILTSAELKTLGQWEKAHLHDGGYFDGMGILALAARLEIEGVRVVHEAPGGGLDNYFDRRDPVGATGQPTILWSRGNHFEALVPNVSVLFRCVMSCPDVS